MLFSEPRAAVLPDAHPLAERDTIEYTELIQYPFVVAPKESDWWREFWSGAAAAAASVSIGAVAHNTDEWLTAIANGFGVSIAPASAERFFARPGVVYRPVSGVRPSEVAVTWRPDRSGVISDFVDCCVAVVAAQTPVAA